VEDARDLIQEFFARVLEKDYLAMADRQRGKFRSFLRAALDHFLANEWRRAHAAKRGGGRMPLSLDFPLGERRYGEEPAHEQTPERIFERRWAFILLEQALGKVREEYARAGRPDLFEHLKPYLGGDSGQVPYQKAAAALGMSEGAVKVAVHRLRKRCREILRAEIAQTVAGPQEVDEELRDLFNVVSR
jgi:RNA polymerase sigma-70 factor (ECF subfamily)